VEDQSAPIPEETTSELGRIIYIVRRAQSRIDQATLKEQVEEQSADEGHCEAAQKLTPLHPSKNGGGGEI
jgi:hypothetical protein